VVLTVLKGAEDGDGWVVVRAFESSGRAARVKIELPLLETTFEASFGPHEIKTFRVERTPPFRVDEVNLLEW
jgi:alpha-mannosidase